MSLDWTRIGDGTTHQGLVNGLVFHLDPAARPFGAPGADGGQDARSGDDTTMYQAKYRRQWSPGEVIAEALREHDKIRRYRQPSSKLWPLWQGVDRWIMASNCENNAFRQGEWDAEVVPAFADLGIEARHWTREILESHLADFPGVVRAYFGGENRVFVSLPEAKALTEALGPAQADDVKLEGRDDELAAAERFLAQSAKRILPVVGPGGIGKTRFLLELARRHSQAMDVYWACTEELTASSNWFEHLLRGRATLLVIDEPEDPTLIDRVTKQLVMAPLWKAVIAVRLHKDAALRAITARRNSVLAEAIELKALDRAAFRRFFVALLESNGVTRPLVDAQELNSFVEQITNRFPIWAVLAQRLLAGGESLATLAREPFGLAAQYVAEAVRSLGEDALLWASFVQWLALLGPINVETDTETLSALEGITGWPRARVLAGIERLHGLHLVAARGRLREIEPDTVRDAILHQWLAPNGASPQDRGGADMLFEVLLKGVGGKPLPNLPHVLRSLARVERQSQALGGQVALLDTFETALDGIGQTERRAVARLNVLRFGEAMAISRPAVVARLSREYRLVPSEDGEVEETFIVSYMRRVTHEDVRERLPWAVFQAAGCATDSTTTDSAVLFNEMLELIRDEARLEPDELARWQRGGRAAVALLPRLVHGDTLHDAAYERHALAAARALLEKMERGDAFDAGDTLLVKTVFPAVLGLQWHSTARVSAERWEIAKFVIPSGVPFADGRQTLREDLWRVIDAEGAHPAVRQLAIELVDASHSEANQQSDHDQGWAEEVRDDLRRAHASLALDWRPASEKVAAREIWKWHLRYEEREDLLALAESCEKRLVADPRVAPYAPLAFADPFELERADYERTAAGILDADALERWVRDAYEVFEEGDARRLAAGIVHAVPEVRLPVRDVERLVARWLSAKDARLTSHGAQLVRRRLEGARKRRDAREVESVLSSLRSPDISAERAADVLRLVYDPLASRAGEPPLDEELRFLFDAGRELLVGATGRAALCRLLGGQRMPWRLLPRIYLRLVVDLPPGERALCFVELVEGIGWRTGVDAPTDKDARRLAAWLVGELANVADIDDMSARSGHWLEKLWAPVVGTLSLRWLERFWAHRERLPTATDGEYVAPPEKLSLAQFLRPVSPARPADLRRLGRLLDFVATRDGTRNLARVLARLDSLGKTLPALVAQRIQASASDRAQLNRLAWFAQFFPEGGASWRRIANPVCELALRSAGEERERLLWAIDPRQGYTLAGPVGEVNPHFFAEVERLHRLRDKEREPGLLEYFRLRVDDAERQLARQTQRVAEQEF